MEFLDLTKFRTLIELKRFTESLFNQHITLKKELIETREKLAHTEDLLKNANVTEVSKKPVEEEVLLREIRVIDRLSQNSMNGLNIEEVKQLKMLVDALVATRRKDPIKKESKKKSLDGKSSADLLKMVRDD